MAFNIVESIQKSLGFPQLQKIDPNTQDVKKPDNIVPEDYLAQAAIPAVLTGIYKYTRTDEGNAGILKGELKGALLSVIFGNSKDEVISKVSAYTGNSMDYAAGKMEEIARTSVKIIRENLQENPTEVNVKDLLTAQRHNILVYLPANLQLGDTLQDETLDDRTNKMEGPVSGVMHSIGQVFSSSGNDKKEEI
ncbi:MAG: hypothetical protein ABJA57_11185 [Ginsengibacter sp.]